MIAERLHELGLVLPAAFPPAGNYLACTVDGGLVHVGGHGPIEGDTVITGKVGGDLTLEQGRRAARLTALSILATLEAEIGLDRIDRIVKVFGMVNVAPGFNQTPAVIDGCSDLLVDIFGADDGERPHPSALSASQDRVAVDTLALRLREYLGTLT